MTGPRPTSCPLREAVGDNYVENAESAHYRAAVDAARAGGQHTVCPAWHKPIEHLLARRVLLTEGEAREWAHGAARTWQLEAEDLRRRLDELHRAPELDAARRRLAAVADLVDVRRKTLRMDDLRRALGYLDDDQEPTR